MLAPGLMPDATRSGRSPNAPRHAANTAVAGGASIACTGEVGELVPHVAFDRRGAGAVQLADRGAGAAAVVGGRDHQHVVTVGDERGREGVDARGVDAVVVGHEDPHARPDLPAGVG